VHRTHLAIVVNTSVQPMDVE